MDGQKYISAFSLKAGTRLAGVSPVICVALVVAWSVYSRHAAPLVVTSVTDGSHMSGSLHHAGLAVDIRLPIYDTPRVVSELKQSLGAEYDVVLELDHIHIEYDPP